MRSFAWALVPLVLLAAAPAAAQGSGTLAVDEMTFCTAVQDRTPAGVDTAFASTVEVVYCFTKVVGAADTTAVTHVWYHGDREVARIELAVKGSPWRTWSSKKIAPEWQGNWRVDALSADGAVLKSAAFAVRP